MNGTIAHQITKHPTPQSIFLSLRTVYAKYATSYVLAHRLQQEYLQEISII